jgi:hypothetical protein
MALHIVPGDPNSAANAFIDLKNELVKETAVREVAEIKVKTLTRAIGDLKISANRFVAQIPSLEVKVNHLDNKVIDGLNEL